LRQQERSPYKLNFLKRKNFPEQTSLKICTKAKIFCTNFQKTSAQVYSKKQGFYRREKPDFSGIPFPVKGVKGKKGTKSF